VSDLGIGIIGSGYMARTFAECLKRYTRGGRLRSVAGGTRAPATAAEFGIGAVGSVEELLARSDVDAVVITSPHANHHDHVIAAARAKKHIFLEKPMEVSVARCDTMLAACRENGVTLGMAQVQRWRGSPNRGKRIIDSGKIGQVHMINEVWRSVDVDMTRQRPWYVDPAHGGWFLDAGSHTFDLMRWFAGSNAVRVYGTVANLTGSANPNPTAVVQITFANGVIGNYWMSFELPQPGFDDALIRTQVVGSKGLLNIDQYGKIEAAIDGAWELKWEQPPIDYSISILNAVRLEAFAAELQDFMDAVREERQPLATGEDGRAAVEIVEAALQSSRTGEAVRLPLGQSAEGRIARE
jgi:predicted dehydrogenase